MQIAKRAPLSGEGVKPCRAMPGMVQRLVNAPYPPALGRSNTAIWSSCASAAGPDLPLSLCCGDRGEKTLREWCRIPKLRNEKIVGHLQPLSCCKTLVRNE